MSNNKDIPEATLKIICEEARRNNLVEYLNETCFEKSPEMMSAGNQPVLVESTLILPGHTDICNVLASGDPSPTIQLIDILCH